MCLLFYIGCGGLKCDGQSLVFRRILEGIAYGAILLISIQPSKRLNA